MPNQPVQTPVSVCLEAATNTGLNTAIATAINALVYNQQNTPVQVYPGNQTVITGSISVGPVSVQVNGMALVYAVMLNSVQMVAPTTPS